MVCLTTTIIGRKTEIWKGAGGGWASRGLQDRDGVWRQGGAVRVNIVMISPELRPSELMRRRRRDTQRKKRRKSKQLLSCHRRQPQPGDTSSSSSSSKEKDAAGKSKRSGAHRNKNALSGPLSSSN